MSNEAALAAVALFHRTADAGIVDELAADLRGIVRLETPTTPVVSALPDATRADATRWAEFALWFERDQLWLCKPNRRGDYSRDRVSLALAEVLRRSAQPSDLQRACFSGGDGAGVCVLDAFAGWGMDALGLASAGASVHCLEVQAPMVALVRDVLRRIPPDIGQRVSIEQADACEALAAGASRAWDVIYLDPMFPGRNKGALPGKRLQWLAQLCAATDLPELDVESLLAAARCRASQQVVLKRRRKDPVIGTPTRQIEGTTVRFDIYRGSASR